MITTMTTATITGITMTTRTIILTITGKPTTTAAGRRTRMRPD